jgi:hypothetical protein
MPAPQAEQLSLSAKEYFSGLNIMLPMQWQAMGSQFSGAFSPPELSTPANPPNTLFHEPTYNKYHTDAARVLGADYAQYIDKMCTAISEAIDVWMHNASIVTVTLVGTIGTVLPEATMGPELKPLILSNAPRATQKEQDYSLAIATAISDAWEIWAKGLTGILTYPPFGPPGPNIPAPLMTFTSEGETGLAPELLSEEIFRLLADPGALHARELFDSISQAFFINFQTFKTSSLIAGVIMTPPVPPPPEPPVEEEPEAEEEELLGEEAEEEAEAEAEEMAAEAEPEPEPEPEIEPEPEPEPIPGGVVIPTPGNFI